MIRLNSDTETRPTDAMREAIARAPVGDEQRHEDPSVNTLCERVAALLGKEAAIFLPSGTMGNVIAVKTLTQPGDVMLAELNAHVLRAEGGGAALISGVMTEALAPPADHSALAPGVFSASQLSTSLAKTTALPSPHGPPVTLLCLEQTHNFGGGSIWPLQVMQEVSALARDKGLAVHMDGARLLNAVVASGVSAADYAACVDSLWIDFTKGLGAPIGAVLAGSARFIERARRYKTVMGGAMRQAGIAAGGCLYALDHHVERLSDDHRNAARLAQGLQAMPGVQLVYGMPETNIVFFRVDQTGLDAIEFSARCLAAGVRVGPVAGAVRAVTHLDVSEADIDTALRVMNDVVRSV